MPTCQRARVNAPVRSTIFTVTHTGLPELPQPQLVSVTGVGEQHTPPPPPPLMDELQRPVMPVGTILPTGTVILGLTTSAPGPKMRGLSQNQCKAKLRPQHMSCVTTVKEGRQWQGWSFRFAGHLDRPREPRLTPQGPHCTHSSIQWIALGTTLLPRSLFVCLG